MTKKTISDAVTNISAEYIEKAADDSPRKKGKPPVWLKWAAMAACLCLILSGGFLYQAENRYPIKRIADTANPSPEIAMVPHWADMEIYNQYPQIVMDELEYQATWGEAAIDRLGPKLDHVIANGWDEYADAAGEDASRSCSATVYEIQNISVSCAVAVQYEGTSTYYTAVNSSYRPETLGQFVEDLNLKDTLIINWASYEYHKPISGDASVRFENVDRAKVYDLLLSHAEAANDYSDLDPSQPEKILDICISLPLLGYENISLSVCENGYITTNILSTGKMFYVGEEYTQAFVDYVLHECDGYEIVYTSSPDEIGIPE